MKSPAELTVAFIGLGKMGVAMAANIRRAGYSLAVWNRSADKAAPLIALGANFPLVNRDDVGSQTAIILASGRIIFA